MKDERIVVGVDGTATSIYALRWAAEEAERLDVAVHAVLAVPSPPETSPTEQADRALDHAVEIALPPTHRRLRRRLTLQITHGKPVEVLTTLSHNAVLLVLGRAFGVDPLHTSTMAQVLRRAGCPVAVIPATAPAPTEPIDVATASTPGAGVAEQRVGTVMHGQLMGVTTSTGVDVALQLMVGAGIHHLPVTEHGRCIGLLHETDLVWRMAAWPFTGNPPAASELARKPAPVVSYDATIGHAAAAMFDENSDAVLVTDKSNVVGILTTNDLLALLARPDDAGDRPEAGTGGDRAHQ